MMKKFGIGLLIAVLLIFFVPLKASAWDGFFINPDLLKPKLKIPLIPDQLVSPAPSPTPSPSPSPTPEPTAVEEEPVEEEEEAAVPLAEETPQPTPTPTPAPQPTTNIWQFTTIALGAGIVGAAIAFLISRKKPKKKKKEE